MIESQPKTYVHIHIELSVAQTINQQLSVNRKLEDLLFELPKTYVHIHIELSVAQTINLPIFCSLIIVVSSFGVLIIKEEHFSKNLQQRKFVKFLVKIFKISGLDQISSRIYIVISSKLSRLLSNFFLDKLHLA